MSRRRAARSPQMLTTCPAEDAPSRGARTFLRGCARARSASSPRDSHIESATQLATRGQRRGLCSTSAVTAGATFGMSRRLFPWPLPTRAHLIVAGSAVDIVVFDIGLSATNTWCYPMACRKRPRCNAAGRIVINVAGRIAVNDRHRNDVDIRYHPTPVPIGRTIPNVVAIGPVRVIDVIHGSRLSTHDPYPGFDSHERRARIVNHGAIGFNVGSCFGIRVYSQTSTNSTT